MVFRHSLSTFQTCNQDNNCLRNSLVSLVILFGVVGWWWLRLGIPTEVSDLVFLCTAAGGLYQCVICTPHNTLKSSHVTPLPAINFPTD